MAFSSSAQPRKRTQLAAKLIAHDGTGLDTSLSTGWSPAAGDLPDINVWLALAVQEHPHHIAARQYWEKMQQEMQPSTYAPAQKIWFCRTTVLGLVRLLTQAKVVGPGALTLSHAWALYQNYRAHPCIDLLSEPDSCEGFLQTLLTSQGELPSRLWIDAYLASLAQSAGLRLVSFDKDFERFGLTQCLILKSGGP